MKIPQPPPELDQKFFYSIGKIAFIHAGIEQDLKDVLIEDWDFVETKIENLFGGKLRNEFLKSLKVCNIPDLNYQEFLELMNRFESASKKRNNLIKATYGYFEKTGEIYKYDLKIMRDERSKDNWEEEKKNWMEFIKFDDLDSLINELSLIREANFQLCKSIHLGKHERVRRLRLLGFSIPNEATKNIYSYIKNLGAKYHGKEQFEFY